MPFILTSRLLLEPLTFLTPSLFFCPVFQLLVGLFFVSSLSSADSILPFWFFRPIMCWVRGGYRAKGVVSGLRKLKMWSLALAPAIC